MAPSNRAGHNSTEAPAAIAPLWPFERVSRPRSSRHRPHLLLACLLGALLSGCQTSTAPSLALATEGGDAWTFDKLIAGTYTAGGCDEIVLHSTTASVRAWTGEQRFQAKVPLQSGNNRLEAACLGAGAEDGRTAAQQWHVRLQDMPKAWIRTRIDADTVWLNAGRSELAQGVPAPIIHYEWRARPGNPEPLRLAANGPTLDQQAAQGKQLRLQAPLADGEYYVTLRITDALARADESMAVFRVEHGRPTEVELAREHPAWVDSAVVYGVVPYFFGSTGFVDVSARLDEIAALGATAIWLPPVTAAPADDFGYAVTDPFRLRPRFGSAADFRALVERAHALGLRVIMDFVPNHVSDQHPYYLHAQRFGQRSPYYDWFDRDAAGEVTSYFDWDNLKNLDYDNPEVQNYILAASAYWIKTFAIDGFRVDAGWGVRQRAPEFWRRWREELKRIKPDLLLLVEASARDRFYAHNGFDAAYDWSDKLGEWAWQGAFETGQPVDLGQLRAALSSHNADRAPGALIFRYLNNNDTGERFISRYGPGLTRVAAALLFTVPGIPLIYTGDEIGAKFEPYDEGPPLIWHDQAGLTPYYTRLAHLRRTTPALWSPRLVLVGNDREDKALSFVRPGDTPEQTVLVVLNFSSQPLKVALTHIDDAAGAIPSDRLSDRLSGETVTLDPRQPTLRLPAYGVMILREADN